MITDVPRGKPVVAAFDFDGTITTRDTLLPFLLFSAGKGPAMRKLAKLFPQFISFLFHQKTRHQVKESVLKQFFSGMPMTQLLELGEAFSKSEKLKQLLNPRALKRIEWHRRQNHRCILVSASLDVYLQPWTEDNGFHDLICSRVEVDEYGIVTGCLKGSNCRGPEKVRQLEKLLGPRSGYILYAYGDSNGDHDLLSFADYPFYKKMPNYCVKLGDRIKCNPNSEITHGIEA